MAFLVPGKAQTRQTTTATVMDIPPVVLSEKTRSYVESLRQKKAMEKPIEPEKPAPTIIAVPTAAKKASYASIAKQPVASAPRTREIFPREFVDYDL